jgi:hypothetical protein
MVKPNLFFNGYKMKKEEKCITLIIKRLWFDGPPQYLFI